VENESKIASMLTVGSQGVYEWLVTDRQFDFLRICPDVVQGPLARTDAEPAIDEMPDFIENLAKEQTYSAGFRASASASKGMHN
jgi:hypothetical protein